MGLAVTHEAHHDTAGLGGQVLYGIYLKTSQRQTLG